MAVSQESRESRKIQGSLIPSAGDVCSVAIFRHRKLQTVLLYTLERNYTETCAHF